MKSKILILLIIFLLNIKNTYSKENENYILVTIIGNRYDVGVPNAKYNKVRENNKKIYNVEYYTKSECLEKANNNINLWKDPKNKERKGYYYKVVDKYYAISADVDNIYNVFCIPVKMWNKMKPEFSKNDRIYAEGIDNVVKTSQSFAEVMKKCGFTAFDYDHINLHDTPFICDKYNEKNPIPYVSYDEILSKKK